MSRFQVKNWLRKNHIANRYELALEMKHLSHDRAFWTAVIASLAIFALILLVAFAVWASTHTAPMQTPLFPYI